jgi:hypothetical protein
MAEGQAAKTNSSRCYKRRRCCKMGKERALQPLQRMLQRLLQNAATPPATRIPGGFSLLFRIPHSNRHLHSARHLPLRSTRLLRLTFPLPLPLSSFSSASSRRPWQRVLSPGHARQPWRRSGAGSRVRAANSSRRGGGGGAGAGRVGPKSDAHEGGGRGPEAAGAGGGGGSGGAGPLPRPPPHDCRRRPSPRRGAARSPHLPAHPLRGGLLLRAPSPSRSPSSSSPLSLSSLP